MTYLEKKSGQHGVGYLTIAGNPLVIDWNKFPATLGLEASAYSPVSGTYVPITRTLNKSETVGTYAVGGSFLLLSTLYIGGTYGDPGLAWIVMIPEGLVCSRLLNVTPAHTGIGPVGKYTRIPLFSTVDGTCEITA